MSDTSAVTRADDVIEPSPFVKWAGGKAQLLSQYEPYFPDKCDTYYEPFVGGGAVFFYLRQRPLFANKFRLSDANSELILTYTIVRDHPDELLRQLKIFERKHREYGREFYYAIRAWDRSAGYAKRRDVSRAARFIYLNKTCFNGLWRVNNDGQFNVPMGRYRNPNIVDADRVTQASVALQDVEVAVADFEDAVRDAKGGDFVYFDPPYVPLNGTSNFTSYYEDGFGYQQQIRLAELFRELHHRGCKVMLSNSDTPAVRDLYSGLGIKVNVYEVFARRQINSDSKKRGQISELLITNYSSLESKE